MLTRQTGQLVTVEGVVVGDRRAHQTHRDAPTGQRRVADHGHEGHEPAAGPHQQHRVAVVAGPGEAPVGAAHLEAPADSEAADQAGRDHPPRDLPHAEVDDRRVGQRRGPDRVGPLHRLRAASDVETDVVVLPGQEALGLAEAEPERDGVGCLLDDPDYFGVLPARGGPGGPAPNDGGR